MYEGGKREMNKHSMCPDEDGRCYHGEDIICPKIVCDCDAGERPWIECSVHNENGVIFMTPNLETKNSK